MVVASPSTGMSPTSPASATVPTSAGIGSSLSPDLDVQAAARNSNQDFTTSIPQVGVNADGEPDFTHILPYPPLFVQAASGG